MKTESNEMKGNMKTRFKLIGLLMGLALLFVWTAEAQIGIVPRSASLTGGATNLTAGDPTNLTTAAVSLFKGRGLSLWFLANHTNNVGTSNTIIDLQVSYDGTAWAQPAGFAWAVAPSGTWQTTNYPAVLLDNAKFFRINTLSNGHATSMLFITNIVWSATP